MKFELESPLGIGGTPICRKPRGSDRHARGTKRDGQGAGHTMTSTVRAGSVTTHVLRNDNLQHQIDVRTRVERGLCPAVVSIALYPRNDGVQSPVPPPCKHTELFSDGAG